MKLKLLTLILALFLFACTEPSSTTPSADTTEQSEPDVVVTEPIPDATPDVETPVEEEPPTQEDDPEIPVEPEPIIIDDPPITVTPPESDPTSDATTDTQPDDTEEDATDDTDPAPPIIIEPDPVEIKFAVHVSSDLYLYDGSELLLWGIGVINRVSPMEFSIDDTVYTLDISGNEVSSDTLLKTPTAIKRTPEGVYWCYQYSKSESYSMGGRYAYYSEFYLDDEIISEWYFNQTECRNIISVGLNVWSTNENGAYNLISGTASNVMYVEDNEFFIHNRDRINKTIMFGIYPEEYSLNYILNATEWIDSSGDYYSGNGYIWGTAGRLREEATALKGFNSSPYPIDPEPIYGQAPVMLAAGSDGGKLYWIECNSGWLFEYDPPTDTLEQKYRLYIGNGMHETGVEKKPFIKPLISEGVLYFSDDGSIFKIDLESGFINIFYAGQGEIVRYE